MSNSSDVVDLLSYAVDRASHMRCMIYVTIVPLREELERTELEDFSAWQPESMPRLDSFLKESARLNPSDASEYKAARTLIFPS